MIRPNDRNPTGLDRRSAPDESFRPQAVLWLAGICFVILLPFTLRYFVVQAWALAAGTTTVLALLLYGWIRARRGWYSVGVITFIFVPTAAATIILSLHQQGVVTTYWMFPLLTASFLILPVRWGVISSAALIVITTPIVAYEVSVAVSIRYAIGLILIAVFAAVTMMFIERQEQRLWALATTDSLTGLLNRNQLWAVLDEALAEAEQSGQPVSLLAMDIDHFKDVNDTYGHGVGDEVIADIGRIACETLPEDVPLFRLGGEEYLAVLAGHDRAGAHRFGCHLVALIRERTPGGIADITVSVGTAEFEGQSVATWLSRVDEALYRAKRAGRDRAAH